MNGQNKPNARQKRVVGAGKGIEKKGEGLGIGPVGQMPGQSAFEHVAKDAAKDAAAFVAKEAVHHAAEKATQGASRPAQGGTRPSAGHSAPGGFFGQAQQAAQKATQGASRPAQGASRPSGSRPATGSTRPSASRPTMGSTHSSASRPGGTQSSGQSRRGGVPVGMGRGGCSGKLLLIVIAVVAFFVLGGKNLLFGGGDNNNVTNLTTTTSQTSNQTTTQNSGSTSGSGSTQSSGSGSGTSSTQSGNSIMNLLSSFLGSTGSGSAYDFEGTLTGLTGGSGSSGSGSSGSGSSGSSGNGSDAQYFTTSMENNTATADTSVASGARGKYTTIKGKNKDTMTILVYMCGADLESENGMASSDLKEMVNANLSDKVNVLVYTGGARKWKNNVVSARVNQIYRIKKGSLERLVENDGKDSMTSPKTLARFIQYGAKNYPANRMVLIFWDHGGGSVSGYGYDERYGQGQTMTLAGINEALANGGVKFDFIGFDTCLMSTVENGLMLDSYADYMIASEESEPGVGWYYTNWLNKVSKNTSTSTVEIGKTIVDDFVEVCNRQCRGQATTLSVTDLAELGATVPKELREFSIETNELIQNKEYKKVAQARSQTREFATHARIDQIDLIHFAKNLGTKEAADLAKALQGAIKYNRTGGGISNAYGLSIYFPYKQAGTVNKAVAAYQAIGMEDEYVRCIQEFASLEVSGQLGGGSSLVGFGGGSGLSGLFGGYGSGYGGGSSSGSSSGGLGGSALSGLLGGYGSSSGGLGGSALSGLLESLGGGGSSYSSIGSGYSGGALENLLGGYYGGGSSSGSSYGGTGSILDLFIGRSLTAKTAAAYIQENHFDPSILQWKNGRISFTDEQLSNLVDIQKNMFFDDGEGYINMGFDTQIETQGNDLIYEFDGTWLSIDRQPVAYYRIGTVEQDTCYAEIGYVPAYVNGTRADLILVFDQDNPYGYIAGAMVVYMNGETDTEAKNLVGIGKGDQIQFVCDYLDYKGNYQDTYKLGDPITLGDEVEIANTYVDAKKCRLTYCLTDIYQGHYWTPVQ